MKYHINPNTGMPGTCYAKQGNCPYGGEDSHYSSYEEAQDRAYEIMEAKYPIAGDPMDFDEDNMQVFSEDESEVMKEYEEDLNLELDYSYLEDYTDEEIIYELEETKDSRMLNAVLSRQILTDGDDSENQYIITAAKNDNIPQVWIDDAVKNPDAYTFMFMNSIVQQPRVGERQLFDIAQGTKNERLQEVALTNPKLRKITITTNIGEDGLKPCSDLALFMAKNPNCPSEAKKNGIARLMNMRSKKALMGKR